MSEWTDERVETIKTLWLEGWSGAQIAKHLGDVSRSAVMAKLDRAGVLGVKRKAGASSRQRLPSQTLQSRARVVHISLPPKPLPPEPIVTQPPLRMADGRHVGVLDLTSKTCRWPIGDPCDADFHFCGHQPAPDSPYCEAHISKARLPQSRKGGSNASAA